MKKSGGLPRMLQNGHNGRELKSEEDLVFSEKGMRWDPKAKCWDEGSARPVV